jgi:hypothetical protein
MAIRPTGRSEAGFACGALLMPQTELVRVVKAFHAAEDLQ